jgi:septal ring-binding cell division protein DamX
VTTWRIEERHVSRMGEAHWLVVSGGYRSRAEAEVALTRLNARGRASERRISELPE